MSEQSLKKHTNFDKHESIGEFEITQSIYPLAGKTPVHSHESAYFSFIFGGKYTLDCRGKGHFCDSSSIVYFPRHIDHAVYRHTPVKIFSMQLSSEFLEHFDIEKFISLDSLAQKNSDLKQMSLKLHREFSEIDEFSPIIVENLISLIAAKFFRNSDKLPHKFAPKWLMNARDLIAEEFTEKLTIVEIAKIAGVHPTHLAQEFRRHFNLTIGEFARNRRVEFSCHRLKHSKIPISEIAVEAGFFDQSHFTRIFKKATGMTPAVYQRNFQNT